MNDNKSVKSKRDKKSEPGVGTLTKDQTVVVQKKIQEQIKKTEDQFKIQEKKSKTQSTKCFENDLIPGLGSFPRNVLQLTLNESCHLTHVTWERHVTGTFCNTFKVANHWQISNHWRVFQIYQVV